MLDLFGRNSTFLIQNKTKHKTLFGGILTIVLFIITIVLSMIMGKELIYRTTPIVNILSQFDINPEELPLFNNFDFMIGIEGFSGDLIKKKQIAFFEALMIDQPENKKEEINLYNLNLEQCNETYKDNADMFEGYDKENYFCISKNQSIPLETIGLEGYMSSKRYKAVMMRLYDCQNYTEDDNCEDQEVIDLYLQNAVLKIVIRDHFVNTKDFKTPFKPIYHFENYLISNTYFFQITFYLKHLYMLTDKGYIFSSVTKQKSFQHEKIDQGIFNSRIDPYFVNFGMILSCNQDEYYRQYYKLQELFAQTGGIYQIAFILLKIIELCFSEHTFYEYLINKYFEINFGKKSNSDQTKKELHISGVVNNISMFKNPNPQKSVINTSFQTPMITSFPLHQKKKEEQLRLNQLDKLFLFSLCSKTRYVQSKKANILYRIGRKEIQKLLDIDNVLKTFNSNKIILNMMINEQNIKLFDYLFQPMLSVDGIRTRYDFNNIPVEIKEKLFGKNDFALAIPNISDILKGKGNN